MNALFRWFRAAASVDAFRREQGRSTPQSGGSPAGLVDAQAVERMWSELESAGLAATLRATIRDLTGVRR